MGVNAVLKHAILAIWRSQASENERPFPARKDSFIHGSAASESEFGQDNSFTRNTGDPLQNRKGSTEGAQGYLPLPLP